MKTKTKTKFKPTIGQAIKMLLCAICRVEMSMEIETEEVRHICKPNIAGQTPRAKPEGCL